MHAMHLTLPKVCLHVCRPLHTNASNASNPSNACHITMGMFTCLLFLAQVLLLFRGLLAIDGL